MKHVKRNITIITALILVCGAVYMNWDYNMQFGKADPERVLAEDTAAEAANTEQGDAVETAAESAPVSDYFAQARLARQRSRDEAVSLLESATEADSASQETVDNAMNAISAMANASMTETQIENLLLAKNFEDCVVYIGAEKVTVAVPAPMEGLSEEAVARITEVICSETDYSPTQLSIIEVKA